VYLCVLCGSRNTQRLFLLLDFQIEVQYYLKDTYQISTQIQSSKCSAICLFSRDTCGKVYMKSGLKYVTFINLMFVDPCITIQFIKKNPIRCNNVSKFYYSIFIWSSACFGRHTAHHQVSKTTALAASGFSYVEGCWMCIWWTLSGTVCLTTSTIYTSNNLPRMKNQRLSVQLF